MAFQMERPPTATAQQVRRRRGPSPPPWMAELRQQVHGRRGPTPPVGGLPSLVAALPRKAFGVLRRMCCERRASANSGVEATTLGQSPGPYGAATLLVKVSGRIVQACQALLGDFEGSTPTAQQSRAGRAASPRLSHSRHEQDSPDSNFRRLFAIYSEAEHKQSVESRRFDDAFKEIIGRDGAALGGFRREPGDGIPASRRIPRKSAAWPSSTPAQQQDVAEVEQRRSESFDEPRLPGRSGSSSPQAEADTPAKGKRDTSAPAPGNPLSFLLRSPSSGLSSDLGASVAENDKLFSGPHQSSGSGTARAAGKHEARKASHAAESRVAINAAAATQQSAASSATSAGDAEELPRFSEVSARWNSAVSQTSGAAAPRPISPPAVRSSEVAWPPSPCQQAGGSASAIAQAICTSNKEAVAAKPVAIFSLHCRQPHPAVAAAAAAAATARAARLAGLPIEEALAEEAEAMSREPLEAEPSCPQAAAPGQPPGQRGPPIAKAKGKAAGGPPGPPPAKGKAPGPPPSSRGPGPPPPPKGQAQAPTRRATMDDAVLSEALQRSDGGSRMCSQRLYWRELKGAGEAAHSIFDLADSSRDFDVDFNWEEWEELFCSHEDHEKVARQRRKTVGNLTAESDENGSREKRVLTHHQAWCIMIIMSKIGNLGSTLQRLQYLEALSDDDIGRLRELLDMVQEPQATELRLAATQPDSKLRGIERQLLPLLQLNRVSERLRLMSVGNTLQAYHDGLCSAAVDVASSASEVCSSNALKELIHAAMNLRDYVEQGPEALKRRGSVAPRVMEIGSLLSGLREFKAGNTEGSQSKVNLLHFFVRSILRTKPNFDEVLRKQMPALENAMRIPWTGLCEDLAQLRSDSVFAANELRDHADQYRDCGADEGPDTLARLQLLTDVATRYADEATSAMSAAVSALEELGRYFGMRVHRRAKAAVVIPKDPPGLAILRELHALLDGFGRACTEVREESPRKCPDRSFGSPEKKRCEDNSLFQRCTSNP